MKPYERDLSTSTEESEHCSTATQNKSWLPAYEAVGHQSLLKKSWERRKCSLLSNILDGFVRLLIFLLRITWSYEASRLGRQSWPISSVSRERMKVLRNIRFSVL